MDRLTRLLCLAACAAVWIPSMGHAADGESRTYAILSLIGDKISVVGHESTTGSNKDQNRHDTMTLSDRVLDNTAVVAVDNAIKRLDARATTVSLASSDPKLYELQDKLFEPQEQSLALLESVKIMLQNQNATHLVLITKHRSDAKLRLMYQYAGSGKIEGLGFYLDATLRTTRPDTHAVGTGFMAPFAYIKLMLVDAKTMAVIRERNADESVALSIAYAPGSLRPADVLTGAQKVAALQRLISKGITGAMPDLLGAR